jgi:hypothetical protein
MCLKGVWKGGMGGKGNDYGNWGFGVKGWGGESVRRSTSYLMLRGDSEEAQKGGERRECIASEERIGRK